ncbi:hypothetical protein TNCV_1702781 [Trichonephila clavipes]|nr:hypothetical protein TNCV_1702781 [Trichonephila clavipes]
MADARSNSSNTATMRVKLNLHSLYPFVTVRLLNAEVTECASGTQSCFSRIQLVRYQGRITNGKYVFILSDACSIRSDIIVRKRRIGRHRTCPDLEEREYHRLQHIHHPRIVGTSWCPEYESVVICYRVR